MIFDICYKCVAATVAVLAVFVRLIDMNMFPDIVLELCTFVLPPNNGCLFIVLVLFLL